MNEHVFTPVLRAQGITVTVAGDAGSVRVLDDVHLQLAAGEIIDVVGPSGCGKTTLLRALARLLPGAHGALWLNDVSSEQIEPHRWRAQVALLTQQPALVPGTVRDNLLLPWTLKVHAGDTPPADETLRKALDGLHLTGVSLERDTERLSVGQRARVALLRTLLTGPKVLLLDEPDANLDDASAAEVTAATATFARAGGAVVRVRHQRSDLLAARRLSMCEGALTEAPS